jgi:peptidoglycan-N-acetylglucosamine deacetylase
MNRHLSSLALSGLLAMSPTLSATTPISFVLTDQPVVALTFDDGPHGTNTPRLLELFAREDVRVTFFEIADNVARYPELARAIVASGHEIANHTRTHANLAQSADLDAVRAEVAEAQAMIHDITGVMPVVFRAPYLAHGPKVWTVLEELGLPSITTRVSTNDWDGAVTREQIIVAASRAGPGDIVLMHTWPHKTVEALPEIIALLRAKGLRFVTVSELLRLAPSGERPAGPGASGVD